MSNMPPERPKGHRPYFFDDPAIDQLHSAVLALTGELAVAFDRIDSLERLLAAAGTLPAAAVDGYRPDEAAALARGQRHADLAARVLKPFKDYRDDLFARAEHAHHNK
jgi:hypothetical protein